MLLSVEIRADDAEPLRMSKELTQKQVRRFIKYMEKALSV